MAKTVVERCKELDTATDKKNLHFLIPSAGRMAFLFLTSEAIDGRIKEKKASCGMEEKELMYFVGTVIDQFIDDVLLVSASLSGMDPYWMSDSGVRKERLEEWRADIPETIEICHRIIINILFES